MCHNITQLNRYLYHLIVELYCLGVVAFGLWLQSSARDGLCANLSAKDAPDDVIIPQRPIQPKGVTAEKFIPLLRTDFANKYTLMTEKTGMTECWTYLASWIQRSVSGGSSFLPRARLEGGSSGTLLECKRLCSKRRMPMGCCRLAKQLPLTLAGSTFSRAECW